MLINKSLTEGIFPNLLKFADICPIFKKGDFDNCGNYRPISLLSNIVSFLPKILGRNHDFAIGSAWGGTLF